MQKSLHNIIRGAAVVLSGSFTCAGVFAQDAYPPVCEDTQHHPQFHQLDWWIGDWTVSSGDQKIASVSIERRPGSCAYLETWAADPSDMTANRASLSYALVSFDLAANLWNFYWVTGVIDLHYHFTAVPAAQLVWERSEKSAEGHVKLDRLTLSRLADGRLQEKGASSTDNGKTWAIDYDLNWRKKK